MPNDVLVYQTILQTAYNRDPLIIDYRVWSYEGLTVLQSYFRLCCVNVKMGKRHIFCKYSEIFPAYYLSFDLIFLIHHLFYLYSLDESVNRFPRLMLNSYSHDMYLL